VWRGLTERLASAKAPREACAAGMEIIAETFQALSVTVWLLDEQQRWVLGASTSVVEGEAAMDQEGLDPAEVANIAGRGEPFDLEDIPNAWAEGLRAATCQQFSERRRVGVAIRAGGHVLGVVVLGDRVYRMPYTVEEFELLRCLADQLGTTLLSLRLGEDLAHAREMETFQTMSAFFVHDLKNSASSLNLMLQNLPQHFDNPEFREDTLRGLARTTGRINDLIVRLGSFRHQLDLNLQQGDLNSLIAEAIDQMGPQAVAIAQDLQLKEPVRMDREQMKSVITNLAANAQDAIPPGGRISIRTEKRGAEAIVTVTDSGCGMTRDFLQKSLFRPFHTTKKKGIGIGMFQSRMIVAAHHGQIQVRSAPGQGTTFRIILPLVVP
jgi:putative PEP-CTERM system histidine kinase